jgi:RimJ/RimL family protein N-acetyltransferase
MTEDDFADIYTIFSDKNVLVSFNLTSFPKEHMHGWIQRNLDHQKHNGYGLFSVILKENNLLIGDCGLEHSDYNGKPCVELGYDFLSQYWNRGFATESANAVKKFAIETKNIDSNILCSFIRKTNTASVRVSEKLGMHKLKEFKKNDTEYFLYGFSDYLVK